MDMADIVDTHLSIYPTRVLTMKLCAMKFYRGLKPQQTMPRRTKNNIQVFFVMMFSFVGTLLGI